MHGAKLVKHCRLCKGSSLESVLKLNDSPICDAYSSQKISRSIYPLEVFQCRDCKFVQIGVVIAPEILYGNYIYETKTSVGLSSHFAGYAESVCKRNDLKEGDLVIDIGSNDGTLLKEFKKRGMRVIGVEPAKAIANSAMQDGIDTIDEFFSHETVARILLQHGRAKAITVNNLFANIDDLDDLVEGVTELLAPEGVLVIESSYLYDMIDNMVFDFIYHEHLSYFSLKPLIQFFKRFGLKITHVERVGTKGGSLRYSWSREKAEAEHGSLVDRLIQLESVMEEDGELFERFNNRIARAQKMLIQTLDQYDNRVVVGYGASATTTTLLTHFEIGSRLNCLIDDNKSKIGTYSPVDNISVHDKKWILENDPDVILVLAWRYAKKIIKDNDRSRGQWIIPLPTLSVVNTGAHLR